MEAISRGWATGFWNPHASCVDGFGRMFTVDNDPDDRPPCRMLHIIPGGDYGYRFRNGRRGIHPFTAWDGELPGTLPMVSGTGEAPNTGHNTIFNLSIQGGENTPVMIVDWQSDPVKENLLHVDLKRIDLTKRIAVKVRVHTTGEPKGVKLQGGLLEVITREVEIECLPDEIPESYTVDVTELMIGQNLRAGDIPLGGSVKLVSGPEQVVAHVVTLKAEGVVAQWKARWLRRQPSPK